jgi:hypothetical protein
VTNYTLPKLLVLDNTTAGCWPRTDLRRAGEEATAIFGWINNFDNKLCIIWTYCICNSAHDSNYLSLYSEKAGIKLELVDHLLTAWSKPPTSCITELTPVQLWSIRIKHSWFKILHASRVSVLPLSVLCFCTSLITSCIYCFISS